ncbi:hypothetical protein [Amycolatopsis sp. NPDC003731]
MAGEFPTAQKLNKNIRDAVNFALNPPQAIIGRYSTNQTGLSGGTAVQFDTMVLDNDNMTNVAALNTRITIVTPGMYDIKVTASLAAGSAFASGSWSEMIIRKNGTGLGIARSMQPSPGGVGAAIAHNAAIPNACVAGDYFEIICNAGGGAASTAVANGGVTFSARWLGF